MDYLRGPDALAVWRALNVGGMQALMMRHVIFRHCESSAVVGLQTSGRHPESAAALADAMADPQG